MSFFNSEVAIWCYDKKKKHWYMSNYGWRALLPWHKVPTYEKALQCTWAYPDAVFIDPDTLNPAGFGDLSKKGLL